MYAEDRVYYVKQIKLWYFTVEGQNEDHTSYLCRADNGYNLAQSGTSLFSKPTAVLNLSKKAIHNKDLTLKQMSTAYPVLI